MQKNILRSLITVCASFLLVGMLSSCSNSTSTSESPSEITTDSGSEELVWVDYAADGYDFDGDGVISDSEQCRLTLDYAGHDFYADGVGQVTLKTCIDGDTAHFYPVVTTTSSDAIKSRFWGIDTPESTGRIQEWGQAASNYTKSILKEADANGTIVVSSANLTYASPNVDSTGSRYVSLIWVSLDTPNCPYNELMLLNLMIVQNGYSYVKSISDLPDYGTIFVAAETQARLWELHLWSSEDDPLFNYGDYEVTSLLDLKHYIEKVLEGEELEEGETDYSGAKVQVTGTIVGYSDGILYLQAFYTEDEGANGNVLNPYTNEAGEYAGINIYCGMSSIPSKFKTIGNYISVCAVFQNSENFGCQLTGAEGHFKSIESLEDEDDAHVILTADENVEDQQLYTFGYSVDELNAHLSSGDIEEKYENFQCYSSLVKSSFTGRKVPSPTCRRISAISTPFSRIFFKSSGVKCNPAVGAAAEPRTLAYTVW